MSYRTPTPQVSRTQRSPGVSTAMRKPLRLTQVEPHEMRLRTTNAPRRRTGALPFGGLEGTLYGDGDGRGGTPTSASAQPSRMLGTSWTDQPSTWASPEVGIHWYPGRDEPERVPC
jgi:hypothetical protein